MMTMAHFLFWPYSQRLADTGRLLLKKECHGPSFFASGRSITVRGLQGEGILSCGAVRGGCCPCAETASTTDAVAAGAEVIGSIILDKVAT